MWVTSASLLAAVFPETIIRRELPQLALIRLCDRVSPRVPTEAPHG